MMNNIVIFCILQFVVNILLAFIVTKYIEKPLHKNLIRLI